MTKGQKNANIMVAVGMAVIVASAVVAVASNGSNGLPYIIATILAMFVGAIISGSALIYKMIAS